MDKEQITATTAEVLKFRDGIKDLTSRLGRLAQPFRIVAGSRECLSNVHMAISFLERAADTVNQIVIDNSVAKVTDLNSLHADDPLPFALQIGDTCVITEGWKASITALTVRASGQVEYQLEWIGDGELKSDWLTLERMRLLGIKVFRDGREVRL